MTDWRTLTCSKGCARTLVFPERPGTETTEAICEECYLRTYGDPSDGFVGFDNGWLRIVRSDSPFEDPPMSDRDGGLGELPLWAALLIVLAFGVALAGLFAWALA